jgi:hypothetical protein
MALGALLVAIGSGLPTAVQAATKSSIWWPQQTNSPDEAGEENRRQQLKEFVEEQNLFY